MNKRVLEAMLGVLEKTADYLEQEDNLKQEKLKQEKIASLKPILKEIEEQTGESLADEDIQKLAGLEPELIKKIKSLGNRQESYQELGKVAEDHNGDDDNLDPIMKFILK